MKALDLYQRALADIIDGRPVGATPRADEPVATETGHDLNFARSETRTPAVPAHGSESSVGYLANHRGQWISTDQLATGIGVKPTQLRGILGALTKRVGKAGRPFEVSYDGDTRTYRMAPTVADTIDKVRQPQGE